MAEENKEGTNLAKGKEPKKAKVEASFDAKKMLADAAEESRKIKYTDRLKVVIVKETRFYKKGQVINPAKIKGEALISQGIAEKYVEEED